MLRKIARNFFSLQEAQSKVLMNEFGCRVQKGDTAKSVSQAVDIAKSLNAPEFVVKCNVETGGRGKGHLTSGLKGGVHITDKVSRVEELAEQMLGYNLITHQTTAEGLNVHSLLILEAVDITDQIYLAILNDRTLQGPVVIASTEGGMNIEEVAEKTPDKIKSWPIDIVDGLSKEKALEICEFLELHDVPLGIEDAVTQLLNLYSLFQGADSGMVEVNPWAVTPGGIYCVDAKINVDEAAMFRQKKINDWREESFGESLEGQAQQAGLSYVELDGDVGCMVNGAGLAMATLDVIKNAGGEPANFLDVGGGSDIDEITNAFSILTANPNLRCILVNIFGGILRCDLIAQGLIEAAQRISIDKPIVVRLEGTRAKAGLELLNENPGKLDLYTEHDLDSAARKAVELAKAQ